MARITTLTDFRNYLKLMTGQPVINVEVSDEQYDQIIEDSIQDFQRYTYGEATYRDALAITLSAGVSAYQMDDSIESVLDISLSQASNGMNTLFSPQHNLLYNDWIAGNYPGGSGGQGQQSGLGGAMAIGQYDIAMIYLKEIEDHFSRKYTANYSVNTNTLRIWPCPNVNGFGLLTVYKRETAESLYNHPLLKKLCRARVLIHWAIALIKYNSSLAGGATLNGSTYLEKGERDEAAAIEAIVKESYPPVMLIG